jgi:ATPase subunit of ABC transporter with duplicated ATPase domains
MPSEKHYVYSARTTEKGLAILNKTKGDRSWDSFLNEAMAAHYHLDLAVISLPPSKFIAERQAKQEQKAKDKAAKVAKVAADKAAKAEAKKVADKAKADKAKADKAKAAKKTEPAAEEKPAAKAPKATKTVKVTVKPGETKVTKGGTRVHASPDNTAETTVPVEE